MANLAFLFIFPGYIIYQVGADAEWFAPALGGFYTAACAITSPLIGWAYLRALSRVGIPLNAIGLVFFTFLFLAACTVAYAMNSGVDPAITGSHAAFLLKFVILFLLARTMTPGHNQFRKALGICLAVVCVLVLDRVLEGGELLEARLSRQTSALFQQDYQGIGQALLVLTLFYLPWARRRWLTYWLVLPSFFIVGARSEFLGFILGAFFIELCKARHRALMLAGWAIVTTTALSLSTLLPDHRMFNLLRPSMDASSIAPAAWPARAGSSTTRPTPATTTRPATASAITPSCRASASSLS